VIIRPAVCPVQLIVRMGKDNERATLIYLHSTAERQRALSDAVGATAQVELAKSRKRKTTKPLSTRRARHVRVGDRLLPMSIPGRTQLLRCWPGPVSLSSWCRPMSPVFVSFWHAAGTGHLVC